jgi:hypothetical protein
VPDLPNCNFMGKEHKKKSNLVRQGQFTIVPRELLGYTRSNKFSRGPENSIEPLCKFRCLKAFGKNRENNVRTPSLVSN